MINMPGKSWSGALPSLTTEQARLAGRLAKHVTVPGEEPGERKLWRDGTLAARSTMSRKPFRLWAIRCLHSGIRMPRILPPPQRLSLRGVAAPGGMTGIHWSYHWSFWQEGYAAVMVTDTALFRYPHYHDSTDTPDRVDYERLARVVAGIAKVTVDLAQP